jgi:membrane protease YdiL (CAAX protease family)
VLPWRLTVVVLAGEALVAAIALGWARYLEQPVAVEPPARGLLLGLGGAAVLAGLNGWMLLRAPDFPIARTVRRVTRDVLVPLFQNVRLPHIVFISAAAGAGEELLFRGVAQPALGIVAASLLFGAAHTSGPSTIGFGLWAACVGFVLGGLAAISGGVVAPIVAHALYDGMAIWYVANRFEGRDGEPGGGAETADPPSDRDREGGVS